MKNQIEKETNKSATASAETNADSVQASADNKLAELMKLELELAKLNAKTSFAKIDKRLTYSNTLTSEHKKDKAVKEYCKAYNKAKTIFEIGTYAKPIFNTELIAKFDKALETCADADIFETYTANYTSNHAKKNLLETIACETATKLTKNKELSNSNKLVLAPTKMLPPLQVIEQTKLLLATSNGAKQIEIVIDNDKQISTIFATNDSAKIDALKLEKETLANNRKELLHARKKAKNNLLKQIANNYLQTELAKLIATTNANKADSANA